MLATFIHDPSSQLFLDPSIKQHICMIQAPIAGGGAIDGAIDIIHCGDCVGHKAERFWFLFCNFHDTIAYDVRYSK